MAIEISSATSNQPPPGVSSRPALRTTLGPFGPSFFILQMSWVVTTGVSVTLLQALCAEISPDGKVVLYSKISTVAAIVATIAMVVCGVLSDRTRSQFGRRKPWIVGGGLFGALAMSAAGFTRTPILLALFISLYQIGVNALLGSITALMPDYLDHKILGKASAVSGAGVLTGQVAAGIAGGLLVTHPSIGLATVPWFLVLGCLLVAVLVPSRSNLHEPSLPFSLSREISLFKSLWEPDFRWTFIGRFFFILSLGMTTGFLLFITTDYIGLDKAAGGKLLAIGGVIFAISALASTLASGTLSDRVGRRKPFVIGASFAAAIASAPLIFVAAEWSVLMMFIFGGLAFGTYIAVDQALMVQVLPGTESSARDLSVLNAANSLPYVVAPVVSGFLVPHFGYPITFAVAVSAALAGAACIFGIRRVR